LPRINKDIVLIDQPDQTKKINFSQPVNGRVLNLANKGSSKLTSDINLDIPFDYREGIEVENHSVNRSWSAYLLILIGLSGLLGLISFGYFDSCLDI